MQVTVDHAVLTAPIKDTFVRVVYDYPDSETAESASVKEGSKPQYDFAHQFRIEVSSPVDVLAVNLSQPRAETS